MGNLGVYVVLSGGARPLSVPHLNAPSTHLGDQTPEPEEPITVALSLLYSQYTHTYLLLTRLFLAGRRLVFRHNYRTYGTRHTNKV